MSLLFPLAVPAAFKAAPGDRSLFNLTVSAILAGAIFGDHWCAMSLKGWGQGFIERANGKVAWQL
jgi:hypothetical protein